MDTIMIQTKSKADVKFLLNLAKRLSLEAKTVDAKALDDLFLISSIEEGLQSEDIKREEIMQALER